MIKTVKETVTREVEYVEDVICNRCGNTCKPPDASDFYGLIEARVSGGYWSPRLGDMRVYVFSLCENCLDELFSTFKIDPLVDD